MTNQRKNKSNLQIFFQEGSQFRLRITLKFNGWILKLVAQVGSTNENNGIAKIKYFNFANLTIGNLKHNLRFSTLFQNIVIAAVTETIFLTVFIGKFHKGLGQLGVDVLKVTKHGCLGCTQEFVQLFDRTDIFGSGTHLGTHIFYKSIGFSWPIVVLWHLIALEDL